MNSVDLLPHLVILFAVVYLARPGTAAHQAVVSTTSALAATLTGGLAGALAAT